MSAIASLTVFNSISAVNSDHVATRLEEHLGSQLAETEHKAIRLGERVEQLRTQLDEARTKIIANFTDDQAARAIKSRDDAMVRLGVCFLDMMLAKVEIAAQFMNVPMSPSDQARAYEDA